MKRIPKAEWINKCEWTLLHFWLYIYCLVYHYLFYIYVCIRYSKLYTVANIDVYYACIIYFYSKLVAFALNKETELGFSAHFLLIVLEAKMSSALSHLTNNFGP